MITFATVKFCSKETFGKTSSTCKLEIRGEIKVQQSDTLMAAISFVRIQEERLNQETRRTRVTPRPAMPRPTASSTAIQAPAPKKLTRDELRERSAKGLCWHYDEPWSREHRCKKGRLLLIEPVEDEDNEHLKKPLNLKKKSWRNSWDRPTMQCTHWLATPASKR
ncbi:hypothetical protein BHE74_00031940 [Ensete ventricosum]|nr:hypothetical protein BHE74_00031940 [Ensete ventricosum]